MPSHHGDDIPDPSLSLVLRYYGTAVAQGPLRRSGPSGSPAPEPPLRRRYLQGVEPLNTAGSVASWNVVTWYGHFLLFGQDVVKM